MLCYVGGLLFFRSGIVSRSNFTGMCNGNCGGKAFRFFSQDGNIGIGSVRMVGLNGQLFFGLYYSYKFGSQDANFSDVRGYFSNFWTIIWCGYDLAFFLAWVNVSKTFNGAIYFTSSQTTSSYDIRIWVFSRATSSNGLLNVFLTGMYTIKDCGIRRFRCGNLRTTRIGQATFSARFNNGAVRVRVKARTVNVRFLQFQVGSSVCAYDFTRYDVFFRITQVALRVFN